MRLLNERIMAHEATCAHICIHIYIYMCGCVVVYVGKLGK